MIQLLSCILSFYLVLSKDILEFNMPKITIIKTIMIILIKNTVFKIYEFVFIK